MSAWAVSRGITTDIGKNKIVISALVFSFVFFFALLEHKRYTDLKSYMESSVSELESRISQLEYQKQELESQIEDLENKIVYLE